MLIDLDPQGFEKYLKVDSDLSALFQKHDWKKIINDFKSVNSLDNIPVSGYLNKLSDLENDVRDLASKKNIEICGIHGLFSKKMPIDKLVFSIIVADLVQNRAMAISKFTTSAILAAIMQNNDQLRTLEQR